MTSQAKQNAQTQPVDLAGDLIDLAKSHSKGKASVLPMPLLEQVRARALASSGAPAALKERWKYTLARRYFQAMHEQQFNSTESGQPSVELAALPSGCTWQPLGDDNLETVAALLHEDDFWQRYPLADLISQSGNAGYCLDINTSQSEPLALKLNPGVGFLIVRLAANVRTTVSIEYTQTPGFAGHWIASSLAPGAVLNQALLIEPNTGNANRWLLNQATLQANSQFNGHVHAFAEGNQRLETHLRLQGQGAQAKLTAASITARKSSFDHQVVMEHQAPNCESHQRVHNIADGGSKNSFNGRIHIHVGAKGSNAQLQNRNLAIAAGAEINTKPELEIYNDNVSCSHGATIGQLDEQALFYLRSRGVPPAQARDLLLRAFIAQCYGGTLATQAQAAADRLLNGALRR